MVFPLQSDPAREAARAYAGLNEADNRTFRATWSLGWLVGALFESAFGIAVP